MAGIIQERTEHLVFSESPIAPGVPVIYRAPEERVANPEKIHLDRKHLSVCPILEVWHTSLNPRNCSFANFYLYEMYKHFGS